MHFGSSNDGPFLCLFIGLNYLIEATAIGCFGCCFLGEYILNTGYKEYKVVHIVEGGCGTILLGSSGLPLKKIEAELNRLGAQGWQVVFQVIEQKRFWLFWTREAMIVTLGR